MKLTKELRFVIDEIEESDLPSAADDLLEWLRGSKKETLSEVFELLDLYRQLTENLTRELVDLRKEQREPVPKFFPMSTTARRRRL